MAWYVGQQFCTAKHELFTNLFIQQKSASSCNLEIAIMDVKAGLFVCLFVCGCCFICFPPAVNPRTTLHIAASVVGVCMHAWTSVWFQQMAFCTEPSGGIFPASWGCYRPTHLPLWFPLKETPAVEKPALQLSWSGAFSQPHGQFVY